VTVVEEPPETWALIWRRGIAPQLSIASLKALRDALAADDRRLIQGMTCIPIPIEAVREMPIQGACALGYAAWKGEGLRTVGELQDRFETISSECSNLTGDPEAVRWFLNRFDDWDRKEMLENLLPEVERGLARRKEGGAQ
jgi:hypothetical protein